MPMGQPPGAGPMPEAGPSPDQAPPEQGGGAPQILADVHSGMLKLLDLVQKALPEDAQQLAGIVSQFQEFADGLMQGPGAQKPQQGPMTVSPEAGGAQVKPVP